MVGSAITNPAVVVNNLSVAVVPNSVKFKEGNGDQKQRIQSAGGGHVDVVFSDDVTTHMGMVAFELINTKDNIDLVNGWKQNQNNNVITLTGNGLQRSFTGAAVNGDPDIMLGSDGKITVEFTSLPAV